MGVLRRRGSYDDVVQRSRPVPAGGRAHVLFGGDDLPPASSSAVGDARDGRRTPRPAAGRRGRGRVGLGGVQVPDDQQGAAGRHPSGDALVERQLRHGRVRVVRHHQVEPRARLPDAQVGLDPLAPARTTPLLAAFSAARARALGGDVGCGDLPALRGEPDRLGATAAAGIQRRARHQAAGLAGEVRVGDARLRGLRPARACSASAAPSSPCRIRASSRLGVSCCRQPLPQIATLVAEWQTAGMATEMDETTLDAVGPRLKTAAAAPRHHARRPRRGDRHLHQHAVQARGGPAAAHARTAAAARPRLRRHPRRARRRAADRRPPHQPAPDRQPATDRPILPLTRRPGGIQAYKFVLPTGRDDAEPDLRTHEGYDWAYVLNGTLRLVLGEHDLHPRTRRGRRVRHPHPALVRRHQLRPRRVPQPYRQAGRTRARPRGTSMSRRAGAGQHTSWQ